jgi:membrane protease YdiL (CAAX protease family)
MDRKAAPSTTLPEAAGIMLICFGWFMLGSLASAALGYPITVEFSDSSLAQGIVAELVLGTVALLILRHRGYSLWEFVPIPSLAGCRDGVLLFVAAIAVEWLVWLQFSAGTPFSQPIELIMAQSHPSIGVVLAFALVNGSYEEIFLLGYLTRGLSAHGPAFALGASVLVRVMCHLYQGPLGALAIALFGLVLGFYYFRTRKLWPVVFAHILCDIIPFL